MSDARALATGYRELAAAVRRNPSDAATVLDTLAREFEVEAERQQRTTRPTQSAADAASAAIRSTAMSTTTTPNNAEVERILNANPAYMKTYHQTCCLRRC